MRAGVPQRPPLPAPLRAAERVVGRLQRAEPAIPGAAPSGRLLNPFEPRPRGVDEPVGEEHHRRDAARLDRRLQFVGRCDVQRDRLVEQQVLPGAGGLRGHPRLHGRRHRKRHGLDVGEQGVDVGVRLRRPVARRARPPSPRRGPTPRRVPRPGRPADPVRARCSPTGPCRSVRIASQLLLESPAKCRQCRSTAARRWGQPSRVEPSQAAPMSPLSRASWLDDMRAETPSSMPARYPGSGSFHRYGGRDLGAQVLVVATKASDRRHGKRSRWQSWLWLARLPAGADHLLVRGHLAARRIHRRGGWALDPPGSMRPVILASRLRRDGGSDDAGSFGRLLGSRGARRYLTFVVRCICDRRSYH